MAHQALRSRVMSRGSGFRCAACPRRRHYAWGIHSAAMMLPSINRLPLGPPSLQNMGRLSLLYLVCVRPCPVDAKQLGAGLCAVKCQHWHPHDTAFRSACLAWRLRVFFLRFAPARQQCRPFVMGNSGVMQWVTRRGNGPCIQVHNARPKLACNLNLEKRR